MFVTKNQHKYVGDIEQVRVGMRKKGQFSFFFMLKWHKALKTFRSGCKSRWPSQSFLAPAFPTPTACAIRNTNQRAEGREEEWVYRKVFEGVGWVHRLFTNGVTRPPRPHPGLVIAPV